jgi:hypothetical protein
MKWGHEKESEEERQVNEVAATDRLQQLNTNDDEFETQAVSTAPVGMFCSNKEKKLTLHQFMAIFLGKLPSQCFFYKTETTIFRIYNKNTTI